MIERWMSWLKKNRKRSEKPTADMTEMSQTHAFKNDKVRSLEKYARKRNKVERNLGEQHREGHRDLTGRYENYYD